ncbi:MAG: tetratricopeptide repeat protein [Xenococcaceae cyanobacterium MO_207.B15]|nr:tetratricopeptide repeat protein [Xenococcaceae cyanobacterium MO_207.B15]
MLSNTESVKISEYLSQGNQHQEQGNIDQCIESYQKAIELNPHSIPALSKLAEIYRNQKEYAKAFTYHLKIVSLRPKNLMFLQNLVRVSVDYSKLLLKKNDLDKALSTYQKFLNQKLSTKARADKIDRICYLWGEVILKLSLRQGELSPAITFFQEAIDNYPHKAWSYHYLGNVLVKQRKLDEALAAYQKAIELKPENTNFYLRLAEVYFDKNDLDGVIDSYQKAVKLKPDIGFEVYKKLAKALKLQGRQNEIDVWMKLAPKPKDEGIYSQIWKALNQTDLKQLENYSVDDSIKIDLQQAEQYFTETSKYKIIDLTSLTEKDEKFLETVGFSLTHLKSNQARLITSEGAIKEESRKLEELARLRQRHPQLEKAVIEGDFQQYIAEKGCIYAICPSTGRILNSNRSLPLSKRMSLCAYRFVGNEVFYLITSRVPMSKVQFLKSALYFPRLDLIVYLHPTGKNKKQKKLLATEMLNHWKAYLVSFWKKIKAYLLNDGNCETVVVILWHHNIGHQIWNNLPGIYKLWQAGNLHKVDKFLIYNSKCEYYGRLEEIFPEIPPEKITRIEDPRRLDDEIYENNYFALRLGGVYIEEELANRIYRVSLKKCSYNLKAEVEEAKNNHFPLLWVTIRLGNRTWLNQVEGLANIIKSLSEKFPTLGVVFDGCSRVEVDGKLVVDEKLEATINKEKETVRQIQSLLPPEIKVYDTVGSRMYESIVWAYAIDLYLAPHSGGTAKVSLIPNKPGVLHTNTVIYKKPLSERWLSWERENGIVPVYVPEEHIVDVTEGINRRSLSDPRGNQLRDYDCDWRAIYAEVLKLAMSIKRN